MGLTQSRKKPLFKSCELSPFVHDIYDRVNGRVLLQD